MRGEYISVITPVYNVEQYLDQCVESVLAQSYQNFELILVDDGSEDSSGKKCDAWGCKDNRIRVIHKKNGGLVSAWSAGLSAAQYEWIVFLDSDDWIEMRHLEMLMKEKERNGADIVVARMKQAYTNRLVYLNFSAKYGNYRGKKLKDELYPIMLNAGGFEKRGVPVSRCAKLIRKSLVQQNMRYCAIDTTYEEDLNIIFPVLMDALSISLIDNEGSAYCYRMVENSMLHGYDRNMRKSIGHVYNNLFQSCADKERAEFVPQIYEEYLSAMIRCYTNELQNPEGFGAAIRNIKSISNEKMLQSAIQQVDWSNYPFKFRIVVKALRNFNWFHANITTGCLMLAKRIV